MRPRPVAVLLLVLSLPACDGIALDGSGPGIPTTCVVKADRPHLSSTALRSGQRTIIGKGWFPCTTSLLDATVRVEIQTRGADGGWRFRAGDGDDHEPVKLRKKYILPVEIPCTEGRFQVRSVVRRPDGRVTRESRRPATPEPADLPVVSSHERPVAGWSGGQEGGEEEEEEGLPGGYG